MRGPTHIAGNRLDLEHAMRNIVQRSMVLQGSLGAIQSRCNSLAFCPPASASRS